jgi:hypothetical protein
MKRLIWSGCTLAALLVICTPSFSQGEKKEPLSVVSVSQLIAAPDKFANAQILVTGYCRLLFEGTAIYAYKEDFDRDLGNQIWLNLRADQLTKANQKISYCIIAGTYNPSNRGHFGMFVGAIEDITRFEPWPGKRR